MIDWHYERFKRSVAEKSRRRKTMGEAIFDYGGMVILAAFAALFLIAPWFIR